MIVSACRYYRPAMQIFRDGATPFRPADAKTFVGAAQMKPLAAAEEGAAVHLYHVQFDNGARTNWHIHSGPQWLFIVSGRIRVQRWGDTPQEAGAGDAVLFAPGEKHWHGAAPGEAGAHLAVNVNAQTTWLEPVADEDYNHPKEQRL
jgi:quercetin dioxygenase-like cupin family protein